MSNLEALKYKKMAELTNHINLRSKQNEAYNIMVNGKNLFITGAGGTGKSVVIKLFMKMYSGTRNIAITSTTGTSALLIGGVTLHSYTGIGLGTGSVEAITTKILKKAWLKKRWVSLNTLIIDEISMLPPDLFDKLDKIARYVRQNDKPFGGIQLILSGDMLQLPCIESNYFCFQADSWNECIDHTIYLDEIIRQSDPIFQKCLNSIRIGRSPPDVREILANRIGADLTNSYGIKPTRLYPLNHLVDTVNNKELDILAEDGREFFEYNMEFSVYSFVDNKMAAIEKFKKYCTAPENLQLCIGAQVMLLQNLSLEDGLANGSRGIIVSFTGKSPDVLPVVKFLSGVERIIDYHVWEVEELDKKILRAIQIPLKVAYAMSIHKSQGSSLDYAEIDLTSVFEYGMSYTALSRVKSLNGLSLIGIDWDLIKAHPDAVEYYENL